MRQCLDKLENKKFNLKYRICFLEETERRSRVKSVDIFGKKYLIIHINIKEQHWILAIVCLNLNHEVPLTPPPGANTGREPDVQPCTILFDSLKKIYTRERKEVCEVLRQLFQVDKIKVITPKVPQQTNGSDCGIFVLQYIESFF
jgi:sentrin-specific protease 7